MEDCTYEVGRILLAAWKIVPMRWVEYPWQGGRVYLLGGWNTPGRVGECTYEVGGIPLAGWESVPMRWVEYPWQGGRVYLCGGWNTPGRVKDCTYEVGGIPLLLQELWQGRRVYL